MEKMAKLFNETIRCYEDGRIERLWKKKGWTEMDLKPNRDCYFVIGLGKKKVLAHRIIGHCFLGLKFDDPKELIDHINGDRTDNNVENLRIVNHQKNAFNTDAKGYYKNHNKWSATICIDKKKIYLGSYETEAEARQAYLDAKLKYHII